MQKLTEHFCFAKLFSKYTILILFAKIFSLKLILQTFLYISTNVTKMQNQIFFVQS